MNSGCINQSQTKPEDITFMLSSTGGHVKSYLKYSNHCRRKEKITTANDNF